MVTQFLVDLSRFLSIALAKPTPVSATQEAGSYKFALITFHGPLPSSGTPLSSTSIPQPSPNSFALYGGWLSRHNLTHLPDAFWKGVSMANSFYVNHSSRAVQSSEMDYRRPYEAD